MTKMKIFRQLNSPRLSQKKIAFLKKIKELQIKSTKSANSRKPVTPSKCLENKKNNLHTIKAKNIVSNYTSRELSTIMTKANIVKAYLRPM